MASLENRIKALEFPYTPAMAPHISITFVCPQRGSVSARLWGGGRVDRMEDEAEAEFLERVERVEGLYGQA